VSGIVFWYWTATQTINVPFANAEAKPAGWDENWNKQPVRENNQTTYVAIAANIKYWNGTTWE
jgi:hypothetical protein